MDESAFGELFGVVEAPLRRTLVAWYGPTLGRDAARHALEWAWAHRSRLDGIDNPAGYLFQVGESHAKRELRRSRVPANSPVPVTVVGGESPFEPELTTALAALSELQRSAVSSRSVSGRRSRSLAAAVVLFVVGGLVAISAGRNPDPEPAAVSTPLSTTQRDTTATGPSVSEALNEARTRWADATVASYRLYVAEDRNYWSRGCTWTTVVSRGVVAGSTIDPSSTTQECPQAEWTVEELHDLVATWLASVEEFANPEFGDHTLQVEYNEIGVPVTMEYDLANGDDEEASMRVTFDPLQTTAALDQQSPAAALLGPVARPARPRQSVRSEVLLVLPSLKCSDRRSARRRPSPARRIQEPVLSEPTIGAW